MDIAALIISGLSLVVAGIGTYWSNKRSKEALAESRRAAADARWSALQEAVQRLIGFDPSAEPIRDRLTNLRIAMLALVDELGDEWEGLDVWLDAERALGATYGRQVMAQARPTDTIERRLDNLDPLMTWAQALSHNLRRLKATGHDASALNKLADHAQGLVASIHERHGWEQPEPANSRIRPLD